VSVTTSDLPTAPAPAPLTAKQRPTTPLVSVICPVYREEQTIREFHRRLVEAMDATEPAVDLEVVYVNDGSDDASGVVLRELCEAEPRARLVDLSRNFGHQLAITSGIDHARGDAVVIIDTDLQDPPEVIARMLDQWRAGYDVVYGVRETRKGESRFKLLTAKGFYRMLNRLSDTPLPVDAGDFRLMDRRVVDVLRSMREENRYMRGMVSWVGFDQVGLPYERDARFAGETKYPLAKMLRFAVDGVTSFSEKPLRLAFSLGTLLTIAAVLLAMSIAIAKLVDPASALPGYASLMVVVLLFGGVQLLSIGLLGEYIGRIYRESKERPLYVVRDLVNFDDEDPR
jgi:polyisoprenyl-phosphate glycosyltransferase